MRDEVLWEGSPSPVGQWKYFAVCLALGWLIVPLWFAWRRYSEIRATRCYFGKNFARISNPTAISRNRLLETHRIVSVARSQPFPLSWFGLSDVTIAAREEFTPPVVFPAVRMADADYRLIAETAEKSRAAKEVQSIPLPILQ